MRQNPERLAWTVLWFAFIVFCLFAVGCPLTGRSYVLHARRGLRSQLKAQRGTVRVERNGNNRVDAINLEDQAPLRLFQGDGMRTGSRDEGLLTLERVDQEQHEALATVKVYENADVVLLDASTPRFGFSSDVH